MSAEPWLLAHLEKQGHVVGNGITRRAQLRTCKCRARILTGLDHPTGTALVVRVDPRPLTPLGEMLAVLEGRHTVSLNHEAGRWVLNERYDRQIQAHPAGTRPREDILAEHRCGQPLPDVAHGPTTFEHLVTPTPTDPPF